MTGDASHMVMLDDLVELRPEKTSGVKDPARPYVGLEHLAQGSPRLLGFLPAVASVSTNCEFKPGDILFGKLRPNLRKSIRVSFPGYCSTDILVLRARDRIDPGFAAHVLRWDSVFNAAISTAAGTKMPRTSWQDLKRFEVLCPERVEDQRLVATILDTADEAIAATEAVIGKLKQVRAGLLHDLLTRGLDEHGQLRDPIAHPEQFKDSRIGRIPREWNVEECRGLCREIVVGIVVKPAQYYVDGGVPVLRSANVQEDGIRVTDLVYISTESNQILKKSMLRAGDVVTVRTGYPGTSCVVPPQFDGANCVDLIVSRPGVKIVPEYLALWINSPLGRDQILRVQGGLAQQHFNVGELKTLLVAKPSHDEQRRIVAQVQTLDANIQTEAAVHRKLCVTKSGLMTDLLTGRVRVPESISGEKP